MKSLTRGKYLIVLVVLFTAIQTQHSYASDLIQTPLPAALCFVYAGETNKPMPSFCVATADSYKEPSDSQRVMINIMEPSFREIIKICEEAPPSDIKELGYQTVGIEAFGRRVVDKQIANSAAIRVGSLILNDAKTRNVSIPDVIVSVRKRLGYTGQ